MCTQRHVTAQFVLYFILTFKSFNFILFCFISASIFIFMCTLPNRIQRCKVYSTLYLLFPSRKLKSILTTTFVFVSTFISLCKISNIIFFLSIHLSIFLSFFLSIFLSFFLTSFHCSSFITTTILLFP